MKRRPQSAIIPKIIKDRSESGIQLSSTIYRPTQQQAPPKEFFEDQESLYFSNLQLKQFNNELRYENSKLKAQIAQLQKKIFKIEKVDKYQQNHDPLGVVQSMDGSIVPILKCKIKEQKSQIDDLQTDLQAQSKSVKLTKLLELQRVIENQQNEILKLKQVIQSALNVNDEELVNDPNVIEKLSKFTITVHQQENVISQLMKQNDKLRQEYQMMSEDNTKLTEELKQINFEKINYKKKLEEQTITESELYHQKKREFLEKKLQATLKQLDSLKGEFTLFENKTRLLTKQIKDQEKEYQSKLIELQKQKQYFEEQCLKKDQLIQDLNDRMNIVELLKQKSSPKPQDSPLQFQPNPFFPPMVFRDQMVQFPEVQSENIDDQINAQPIDKNRLSILLQQLKFKIMKEKLTKERLLACFSHKEFIQLSDAIQVFIKSPFNFQQSDAIIICRYLIGEDQGESCKMQFEDTQEVREIINQLYNNPHIKSNYITFKTMILWNQILKTIDQKLKKCKIENQIYYCDDFALKLKNQYEFTYEQIEVMLLINYIYNDEIDWVHFNAVKLIIDQECAMLNSLHNLSCTNFQIYKSIPKKVLKNQNSDDEDFYSNSKNLPQKSFIQPSLSREIDFEQKPKFEIENKVQNIISSEQILTFSQFKATDQQLQSSESRKPSQHNNNTTSDLFQYSQSIQPQATLKRPIEFASVGDNTIQFNATNQFLSPQFNSKKMSPISEFQSGKILLEQRNLQYNDNETQITEIKKDDLDDEYQEIVEEYIEDL